jgi:hypothetical protein
MKEWWEKKNADAKKKYKKKKKKSKYKDQMSCKSLEDF